MLDLLYAKASDPQFVLALLVAVAAVATVLTIGMPYLERDALTDRMKAVSSERNAIRIRERERLAKTSTKINLRPEAKPFMKRVVDSLNLTKWLSTDSAKDQLMMAGFRGAQAEVAFLFFRLITPIVFFSAAVVYIFFIIHWDKPFFVKVGAVIVAAYAGIKAPEVYLKNTTQKRQKSMGRAYPNALDLLLICVEAGMSVEHAFRKVSQEIGAESVPLAEEFTLTTAEMSFLPDRKVAFDNLAKRTGMEMMKALATVLIQTEKYGTPLGGSLRVLAQEGRDARLNAAEKKAAALPPQLTVPMILFFLPVLFVVILTPALIQIMKWS